MNLDVYEIDEEAAQCRLLFYIQDGGDPAALPSVPGFAGLILASDCTNLPDWQMAAHKLGGVCLLEGTGRTPGDGWIAGHIDEIKPARQSMPKDGILGYRSALVRHEAMLAGEAGADYVLIGACDQSIDDELTAFVEWWNAVTVLPIAVACQAQDPRIHELIELRAGFVVIALDQIDPPTANSLAALFSS